RGKKRVENRPKLVVRHIGTSNLYVLAGSVDRDPHQPAGRIEHRLQHVVVRRAVVQAPDERLDMLVERGIEQGAVEHCAADVVQRDAADVALLTLDDETGAQTVVEALLNGGN